LLNQNQQQASHNEQQKTFPHKLSLSPQSFISLFAKLIARSRATFSSLFIFGALC
jgi:hypothetical protein